MDSKNVAAIFVSQRNDFGPDGYERAADQMMELAAQQPGYIGVYSTRDTAGLGITASYWLDEASARAWHDHPEHSTIREQGRGKWYDWYDLHVAKVTRSYDWMRP